MDFLILRMITPVKWLRKENYEQEVVRLNSITVDIGRRSRVRLPLE